MKINLHIERLVLDDLPVSRSQGNVVREAVERELTQLLARDGAAPRLGKAGAIAAVRGAKVHVTKAGGPVALGNQIANAVHRRIGGNKI